MPCGSLPVRVTEVINHADRDWTDALYRPGGRQMRFLRQLIESRPFFSRIPDQSLIVGDAGKGGLHLQATRDQKGSYAFVYFPQNDQTATIDLGRLRASRLRVWWYDPRTGIGTLQGELAVAATGNFARRHKALIGFWCWTMPIKIMRRRGSIRLDISMVWNPKSQGFRNQH